MLAGLIHLPFRPPFNSHTLKMRQFGCSLNPCTGVCLAGCAQFPAHPREQHLGDKISVYFGREDDALEIHMVQGTYNYE